MPEGVAKSVLRQIELYQSTPYENKVDPEMQALMAVCAGAASGPPRVGLSLDECAAACDAAGPASSDAYCWAVHG